MARALLRHALRTFLGWTLAFAAIGLALGIAAMLARVSPFAESGSSDPSVLRHADWIPILTGVGTAVGLTLGAIAALISVVIRAARQGGKQTEDSREA